MLPQKRTGFGQKLNTPQEDGDAVLEAARHEWLHMLEAPRGRSVNALATALWEPSRGLARVTREKGQDLRVMGFHRDGSQWLWPAEALCLLEDSLLALDMVPPSAQADATQTTVRLSVQEAYRLVLGGEQPIMPHATYAVFAHLYRGGFVCRPRTMPAVADVPAAAVASARPMPPEALLDVYHRRGFARSKVADGSLPALFVAAVYRTPEVMPSLAEIAQLSAQLAPLPLRCAAAWQQQVLLFNQTL